MKRFAKVAVVAALVASGGVAWAANNPPLMIVPGQMDVENTGTASYKIPIVVPPGTSDLVPTMSLAYSSTSGNGIAGLGWSLNGFPSISRCPRTIAQDGVHGSVNLGGTSGTDTNDKFCMAGQRLIVISGSYGTDSSQYRTEIESFSEVIEHGVMNSSNVWFEVHTKSGKILQFGNTTDSQVLTIGLATNVIRTWEVNRISDTAGNYLTVTYNNPSNSDRTTNGESYPIEIDYTGNAAAGVSPYNSVKFSYQCQDGAGTCRQDTAPMYQAGAKTQTTVLLTDIKTYQSGNLVYDYQLSYNAGSAIVATTLASVTLNDGSGNHLNATTFGWQGGTGYLTMSSTSQTVSQSNLITPGDFNGDGDLDVLIFPNTEGLCPSNYTIYNGPGFTTPSSSPFPNVEGAADLCQSFTAQSIISPNGTANVILPIVGHYTNNPQFYNTYFYTLNTGIGNYGTGYSYGDSQTIPVGYAGDINGDGLPDIFLQGSPSGIVPKTASGWGTGYTVGNYPVGTTNISLVDIDGDGCADIFATGSVNSVAYSCNPATTSSTPPAATGYTQVLGDFNGDGKTDVLLVSASGAAQLWLSTGIGFTEVNSTLPSDWGKYSVYVGDFNGDGKADILLVATCLSGGYCSGTSHKIYLSTGTGFVQAVDSGNNPVTISNSASCASGCVTASVVDWNNDGASDIWLQQPTAAGGDTLYKFSYTPQLMTSVSNGIGGTVAFTYAPINQNGSYYQKCSTPGTYNCSDTYPTQSIDGALYRVSRVDASNGLGTCPTNCYSATYSYAMAKTDLSGRGFLGFGQMIVTNLQTNIVQTTSFNQSFPYIGMMTSQTKVHGGTTTLSTVTNTLANNSGCGATPAAAGVYVVCITQTSNSSNDLNGAAFPTVTTAYTFDNYGNPLTINVSRSDGSTKNTTNTYSNDTTNWFLGRVLTTSVASNLNSTCTPSSFCQTRQSSFSYAPATGLLTQEVIEPGVSTCNSGTSSCTLTTNYTLDAFGHRVVTTISGTGITTRSSYAAYDSLGQFQIQDNNALGQSENWVYDSRFGNPTSHTGPNLLATSWVYDTFGRLTQESRPDGTQTKTSYTYCGGGCPTYGAFFAQSEIFASDGVTQVGAISTAFYDSLSRSIANDTQGFDGSNIRLATQFDANERVLQTSRPYFTASGTPHWNSLVYDDLGRVTQATFPDSSHTTYGYNALVTTITNNLSQTTTTTLNAQGLKASVQDALSHATSYVYDAFGNLLTVTDPSSNVIADTFDIRGNKVSSADPDMGTWTYAYDVLGELTTQTDAKSQATNLTYDLLGRVLTRTEISLYTAWTFGASPGAHNIGQIVDAKACTTSACTTVVSDRAFTFDSLGRADSTTLATGGQQYGYHEAYNITNGKLSRVGYPSGFSTNYTYNSYGYQTYIADNQGYPIWTGNARDAELHLTSETQGNGVLTTQSFDPNTGLIQTQQAGASGAVANFAYSFDTIGNLNYRTDNNMSFTERFCYDGLNRLTNSNIGAACTGGKTESYASIGNISTKSDAGTYFYPTPGTSQPHAVSSITGTVDGLTNPKFSYDADGNMTCMSTGSSCTGTIGRQLTVTSFNMAAALTEGSTSTSLTYDDQHARITQAVTVSGTTTTTTYLNDPASGAMSQKVQVGTAIPTWVDYIQVGGQIVAQRTVVYQAGSLWGFNNWHSFNWGPTGSIWGSFNWGSGTWSPGPTITWAYFSLDHLNSVEVISDSAGNVVQRMSYDPWGKQRNSNGTDASCGTITSSTTRGFTNQEQMPAECLVNLNARIYDPSIGRFMAADSSVPSPYDGQSYNRFSYVSNNPLSFTDPTGHDGGPRGFGSDVYTGGAYLGASPTGGISTYVTPNWVPGSWGLPDGPAGSPGDTPGSPQGTSVGSSSGGIGSSGDNAGSDGQNTDGGATPQIAKTNDDYTSGPTYPGGNSVNNPDPNLPNLFSVPTPPSAAALAFGIPDSLANDNVGASGTNGGLTQVAANGTGQPSLLGRILGGIADALNPTSGPLGVGPGGGLGFLPALGEFAGLEGAAAAEKASGAFSTYDTSITGARSILNAQTNVNAAEFESNLAASGYKASTSADGQATILNNGTSQYVIRPSSSGPTTADFYPNGAASPTLKIRLGQ